MWACWHRKAIFAQSAHTNSCLVTWRHTIQETIFNSGLELQVVRDRIPVFINIVYVCVKTFLIRLFRRASCKLLQRQKDRYL